MSTDEAKIPPAPESIRVLTLEDFEHETRLNRERLRSRIANKLTRAQIDDSSHTVSIEQGELKALRSSIFSENAPLLVDDVRVFTRGEFESIAKFPFDRAIARIESGVTRGEVLPDGRIRMSERTAEGLKYLCSDSEVRDEAGNRWAPRPPTGDAVPQSSSERRKATMRVTWKDMEAAYDVSRARLRKLLTKHANLVTAYQNQTGCTFRTGSDLKRFEQLLQSQQP